MTTSSITPEDHIRRAFHHAHGFDASGICISPNRDGVVLSGDVANHSDRLRALVLAREANPGSVIENRLEVRASGMGWDRADPETTEGLKSELRRLGSPRLQVAVQNHIASLEGSVDTEVQRIVAIAAAARTPGVHFLREDIEVLEPAAGPSPYGTRRHRLQTPIAVN